MPTEQSHPINTGSTAGTLQAASSTNPASLAGAIAGTVREKGKAEVSCVGAGAVNQAVKAIAIARGYMSPSGVDLVCVPMFRDIRIEGEERTAIVFLVRPERS